MVRLTGIRPRPRLACDLQQPRYHLAIASYHSKPGCKRVLDPISCVVCQKPATCQSTDLVPACPKTHYILPSPRKLLHNFPKLFILPNSPSYLSLENTSVCARERYQEREGSQITCFCQRQSKRDTELVAFFCLPDNLFSSSCQPFQKPSSFSPLLNLSKPSILPTSQTLHPSPSQSLHPISTYQHSSKDLCCA